MPRPREFDMDQVLDAATAAFWTHGYEATSLQDLTEATGLQKGSIYKAFGDKHSLFLTVLERYLERMYAQLAEVARTHTPAETVRTWIAMIQGFTVRDGVRRGCLGCNTAVELGPHDPGVNEVLQRHLARTQKLVTRVLAAGQASGVFRDDVSAATLSHYLHVMNAGTAATSKIGFAEHDGDDLSDVIFAGLTAGSRASLTGTKPNPPSADRGRGEPNA